MDPNKEKAEQLEEIRDQMLELLQEARGVMMGTSDYSNADAYWLAHLETALGTERYRTYSTTMQDAIDAFKEPMECSDCGAELDEDREIEFCDACDRFLDFASLLEARDFVSNSGVVDWNWKNRKSDQVLISFANMLYRRGPFESFNNALKIFIKDVLCDDPNDYPIGEKR